MKKFIELAHGFDDGKILVLPMASADPQNTGEYQANQLRQLGAKNVDYLIVSAAEANGDSTLKKLDGVSGIFFSGGVQSRIVKAIGGTPFAEKLQQLYRSGAVIGGTSAGAAVMSKIMITGDEKRPDKNPNRAFNKIEEDNIATAAGLGFLDDVIIDQHFVRRKRHNRLISLVLENPKLVGMGIDESTALLVHPNHQFEVLGENSVIVYDARKAKIAPFDSTQSYNLAASNITMHVLTHGYLFDLNKNEVIAPHDTAEK
ncbi:MAG: cyanophycinase [Calditrichaeota bacterium]|nr:cyanophycinase [Calditrichota bacterium]